MYITMHCNNIAMIYMPKKRGRTASMDIRMVGYEVVEKVAKPCATSGRILVPVHWVGKRVKAVLVDP
jgi:hypothetical protein